MATYQSHVYPLRMIVVECALKVGRQLGHLDDLRQPFRTYHVHLQKKKCSELKR